MSLWKTYLRPKTVEGALEALGAARGTTALIAGGTDLLLDMQQGRHPPVDTLVDVSEIDEMQQIRPESDHIFLGAAVTHAMIVENRMLSQHAACLVEACTLIGGPQVRNVATIGGNVAHALPAADGAIALLALDAQAEVASPQGRVCRPLEDLFVGPGITGLDRTKEILVGFRLALRVRGTTSAFRRIMRPQGVAIAILNMAVWLRLSGQGMIEDIRVAIGPSGVRPVRARQTEAVFRGRGVDDTTLAMAGKALLSESRLRTSPHRATAAYREHLVPVLLERTLRAALNQRRGDNVSP